MNSRMRVCIRVSMRAHISLIDLCKSEMDLYTKRPRPVVKVVLLTFSRAMLVRC